MQVDPELTTFSFFEGEVLELTDPSPFDGQLSDLSESDNESNIESNMAASPCSDVKPNFSLISGNISLAGNWTGIRKASNGYRLGADKEDLNGPPGYQELKVSVLLNPQQKEVIAKFCSYLAQNWPSQEFSSDLASAWSMAFIDATGFLHVLWPEFNKFVDHLKGMPAGNKSVRVCQII